jgi:DNA-binding response OmpR family regulator
MKPRLDQTLVLLDLNLPRKNRLEVLCHMQASDSLGFIPIVVFTSSSLLADKKEALDLGAQNYIPKPHSFAGLAEAITSLCSQYLGSLILISLHSPSCWGVRH